jgi:hypothetical protein
MQFAFSPLTACKSLTVNSLGAFRLFVLAKGMAEGDSVNIVNVKETACQFISERQFARDMSAAGRLGLLTIHERKNGTRVFVVVSHERAAIILGATKHSAAKRSTVSLAGLFGENWQAIAFTSWQAVTTQNGGRLISQKKQAQKTGISPQMQRKYNKVCGVKSRSNYAVSNIAANHLDGEKEFGTRASAFAFKNYKLNQSYIAWRLPSSRVVCAIPNAVNAAGVDGVLIGTNPNASRKGSTLFIHGDETSFTKAKKRAAARQTDLYIFSHVARSGAGMFTHFAI